MHPCPYRLARTQPCLPATHTSPLHCTPRTHPLSTSADVKAANLLLKSSTSDPRGFTVKLADFGFAMRLTELAEDGATRYAVSDQACGT